jgi:hypothetical protein
MSQGSLEEKRREEEGGRRKEEGRSEGEGSGGGMRIQHTFQIRFMNCETLGRKTSESPIDASKAKRGVWNLPLWVPHSDELVLVDARVFEPVQVPHGEKATILGAAPPRSHHGTLHPRPHHAPFEQELVEIDAHTRRSLSQA